MLHAYTHLNALKMIQLQVKTLSINHKNNNVLDNLNRNAKSATSTC